MSLYSIFCGDVPPVPHRGINAKAIHIIPAIRRQCFPYGPRVADRHSRRCRRCWQTRACRSATDNINTPPSASYILYMHVYQWSFRKIYNKLYSERPPRYAPGPLLPVGAEAVCAAEQTAVVSHGQHVLTPTAAAA